ncbi:MAG: DNA adenine methylase [Rhodospirillaceae bacterium]|nr:DNA adenine methylase [Rhodospirillaceae bacterium]
MSTPETSLEPVEPAEPLAPWLGGKRHLAKRIAARIEATPHRCYAEPFVGMGGVFLRRRRRPSSEAISDINGDIANLFRIVREHPDELARQFRWAVASRQDFRRLLETPPEILTNVQRAARFAYLQRLQFAGRTTGTSTNFGPHYPARLRTGQMRRLIEAAHRRLQGVHVECLPWDGFVPRYDKPFTLFYIDPPYWGHEADYGRGIFAREDFDLMAELLRNLKRRFILSLNDRPEVRETFAGFEFEAVKTSYSANTRSAKAASKAVGELLISN